MLFTFTLCSTSFRFSNHRSSMSLLLRSRILTSIKTSLDSCYGCSMCLVKITWDRPFIGWHMRRPYSSWRRNQKMMTCLHAATSHHFQFVKIDHTFLNSLMERTLRSCGYFEWLTLILMSWKRETHSRTCTVSQWRASGWWALKLRQLSITLVI